MMTSSRWVVSYRHILLENGGRADGSRILRSQLQSLVHPVSATPQPYGDAALGQTEPATIASTMTILCPFLISQAPGLVRP